MTAKEVLFMPCLRWNATAKTVKIIDEMKKTMEEMKTAIIDGWNQENLSQYIDLRFMMSQMQSSIPRERVSLQHFISTKLENVMACIQKNSSKTDISNLRDTLLDELSSQNSNIEDIVAQLEDGLQV